MKKTMKTAVILFCIFFIALIAALLILKSFFTEENIRKYIDDAAKTYLGRSAGYEKLSFTLIGVKLENFFIKENEENGGGIFAKSGSFSVKVELLPLLKKEVRIKRIIVKGLEINIIKDDNGRFNFGDISQRFGTSASNGEKEDSLAVNNVSGSAENSIPDIILDKLIIKDSGIFYTDLVSKREFSLKEINVSAEGFNLKKTFECGVSFNFSHKDERGEINIPFKASAAVNLEGMDMTLANLSITSLNIEFEDMRINGKALMNNFISPYTSAQMIIYSLTDNTVKRFIKDVPAFAVREAEIEANVFFGSLADSSADIRSFSAKIGDTGLSGKFSVNNFESPEISANVSAASLSSKTFEYFVPELANFNAAKTEFDADINVSGFNKPVFSVKKLRAGAEDVTINGRAGHARSPGGSSEKSAGGMPPIYLKKADLATEMTWDPGKGAVFFKNAKLGLPGLEAVFNGKISGDEDINFDINADLTFALDKLSETVPDIAKIYEPKGKIIAGVKIVQNALDADIKTENVSFKFEPMFTAEKINALAKVSSFDNIKLTVLSGYLNGKRFNGGASYFKTKDSLTVSVGFDMEALVLNSLPGAGKTGSQGQGNEAFSGGADTFSSLPLNLTADLKAGAVNIPHFRSDGGAVLNIKMSGITDKFDKADGNVKFKISSGNIKEADKLAGANNITKMIFGLLSVVDHIGRSLKIGALSGSSNKEGIGFDDFSGDFNFVSGKMTVRSMDFISKSVSVQVSGTSDFKADKIDMRASVRPGPNKPVIMKITGKASQPKGSIDIAASLTSIFGKEIDSVFNKNKKDSGSDAETPAGAVPETSRQEGASASENSSKKDKPAAEDILKSLENIFK